MCIDDEIDLAFGEIKHNIVSTVISEIPSIDHIILYGSYGRGEGGWFYENDILRPYNDFDLLLVVDDKFHLDKNLNEFRVSLALKIGIRWIDITLITKKGLIKTKNSIFGYDLKHGSTVIYGNPNILEIIPQLNNNIDLHEGEILFFTRLWTFVGSIGSIKSLAGDESRFFRNQMAKAIFSIIDVILLIERKYDSSYSQRLKIVSTQVNPPISEGTLNIFEWALDERTNPKGIKMTASEVKDLYLKVANLYRHFMLILLSKKHKRNFNTILQFNSFYRHSARTNFKRLAYLLIKRNNKFERIYFTNIIQMNVLSILLRETDEQKMIAKSLILFKKIKHEMPHDVDLSLVKAEVSKIRTEM